MSSHTTLNAAAADRKARLAALKSLKRKAPSSDSPSDTLNDAPADPSTALSPPPPDSTSQYLSGRNYDPSTRAPKLGFDTLPAHLETASTLESRATQLSHSVALEQKEVEKDEPLDLFKLQPKRPNWDLKRDLREKMRGLEGETENAIARLVRERVEGVKAVKVGGSGNGEAQEVGMEGVALVEAMHVREREEEQESGEDV